jgi:methylmalonyl-CoA mutase
VRGYHRITRKRRWRANASSCSEAKRMLAIAHKSADFDDLIAERDAMDGGAKKLLAQWPDMQAAYAGDEYVVKIRDKEIRTRLCTHAVRHAIRKCRCRASRTTAKSCAG